jgi:hypothetical protein
MKRYKIKYFFDGYGSEIVEANNKEEAREMFYSGELNFSDEWGDNYNVDRIEEL